MNQTNGIDLASFYQQFTLRKYNKGELLVRADDDPSGIFYLNHGYVRRYLVSKTGYELTLQILKPISYFPMVWAINGTPNVYDFKALTPVEVGRAPRDQIINFIQDKPKITFTLMSELLGDYAETLNRVEHLVFSDAYRKVISVLLYIAKNFGEVHGKTIIVHHHFTHQDIASLIGVARETASNEMLKLKKNGLVMYVEGTLLFENIEKLEFELTDPSY